MQISKKGNLRDKTLLFQGRGVICFPEYLKPLFWLYKSNIEVLMISTVDPNGNLPYLANSYKSLCCLEWNGKGGGNLKLFEEDISSKLITDNFPNRTRFSLKPNFIRRCTYNPYNKTISLHIESVGKLLLHSQSKMNCRVQLIQICPSLIQYFSGKHLWHWRFWTLD